MSSKTKTTVTNEEATHVQVPKLRFPDFRGANGWKFIPLDRLAVRVKQKNRDENIARVLTNSAEFGVVDQRDFFDKDIAMQGKLEGYFVVELGSYVYNPRISAAAPVGPISKNKIGTGVMSPLYTVFKFKDERDDFYQHFFKTVGWHSYMRQSSSTGARHDRMAISNDDFMAMPLPISSPDEQEKIADCLNSMDELIVAQAQKMGALKIHKKWLMQQLFPREGETQPRLRFPEFQNAREWVPKTLVDACRMQAGKFVAAADIKEQNAGDLFPCYGGNGLRGYTVTYTHDGVYPLIGRQGALCGNVKLATQRFHATEHAVVATPNHGIEVLWLYYLLGLLNLNNFATGQAQPGLSVEVLEKVPVTIPKDESEQQRIASCLSSLDALITAEAQKLEALKTHKKGLMQQLFPSQKGVEA